MWSDNTTTVLLIAPIIMTIAEKIGMDPRPLLVSMILFSNIGGAGTMVRLSLMFPLLAFFCIGKG
jgi:Na+/H+ antiporter NhaD/arsenite permease-like protein